MDGSRRRGARNALGVALHRAGLTDADLARLAGMSRSRVNLIKNARAVPTLAQALAIARVLDVEVEDLFGPGAAMVPDELARKLRTSRSVR